MLFHGTKMIKLEISFDGQNYLGWQIQKDFTPTVQEKINLALKKIYKVSWLQLLWFKSYVTKTDVGAKCTSTLEEIGVELCNIQSLLFNIFPL